jgi:hypothetical protein
MTLHPYLYQAQPFIVAPLIFDGSRLSLFEYHDGLQRPLARIIQRPWLANPSQESIIQALTDLEVPSPKRITVRGYYPPDGYVIPEWSLYDNGTGAQDFVLHAPSSSDATSADPAFLCAIDPETLEVGDPLWDTPGIPSMTFLDHWKHKATRAVTALRHTIAAGA